MLINEFAEVFKDEIGCLKGITVNIEIKEGVKAIHLGPRKVPYALTD